MGEAIVPIVEGLAEVESVPILLRRVLADLDASGLLVSTPFRVKRNRVVKEGELERAITQASRSRPDVRGILVLLDADDVALPNSAQRCWRGANMLRTYPPPWFSPRENWSAGSWVQRSPSAAYGASAEMPPRHQVPSRSAVPKNI